MSCDNHETMRLCEGGTYGPIWNADDDSCGPDNLPPPCTFKHFAAVSGIDAGMACCSCGGGERQRCGCSTFYHETNPVGWATAVVPTASAEEALRAA